MFCTSRNGPRNSVFLRTQGLLDSRKQIGINTHFTERKFLNFVELWLLKDGGSEYRVILAQVTTIGKKQILARVIKIQKGDWR